MQASVVLRESVLATDQLYDYLVPPDMASALSIGQFVEVPFGGGNRFQAALVMAIGEDKESRFELKKISRIIDPYPVLFPDQIALLPYIRSRYSCTYGDAIRLMVPSSAVTKTAKSQQVAFVEDPGTVESLLAEGDIDSLPQVRILELLLECEEIAVSEIMSVLSISRSPIDTLRKKGLIGIRTQRIEPPEAEQDGG